MSSATLYRRGHELRQLTGVHTNLLWSLAEWVLDGDCAELLAVLQVLRVENSAACVLRGGDDEAVVPAKAIALLDADGVGDEGK